MAVAAHRDPAPLPAPGDARWPARYVGLEFEPWGRGPRYDCWGLVRLVMGQEFGIELPCYAGAYGASSGTDAARVVHEELASRWTPILQFAPGDIVLFHGARWHAGVVVRAGVMLHMRRAAGAVVESFYSPLWRGRFEGGWRIAW